MCKRGGHTLQLYHFHVLDLVIQYLPNFSMSIMSWIFLMRSQWIWGVSKFCWKKCPDLNDLCRYTWGVSQTHEVTANCTGQSDRVFQPAPHVFQPRWFDPNPPNHWKKFSVLTWSILVHDGFFSFFKSWILWDDLGVSLNGGTPNLHPKMIIFDRKSNGCWGNPPF